MRSQRPDTGLSSRQVVRGVVQVVDCRSEAVLHSTQTGTSGINFSDCFVNGVQIGCFDCFQVKTIYAQSSGVSFSTAQVQSNSVAIVNTNLNRNFTITSCTRSASQQFDAVEVSLACNAVDFSQTSGNFILQRGRSDVLLVPLLA